MNKDTIRGLSGGKSKAIKERRLTNCGISKHHKETGIVYPLYLETAAGVLIFGERRLDVPRLQLFRKASQGKNAGDRGRELGDGG